MSQLIKFTLFIFALFSGLILGVEREPVTLKTLPFKESINKKISSGEIYGESIVTSFSVNEKKMQELHFKISGLHPKDCRFALRKLSRYEKYKDYIGFVKMSTYDDRKERVYFVISSALLPFNMALTFKVPRIVAPGVYPFSFDQGFLSGLTGEIHVAKEGNRCLFYTSADWRGPDSKIPNGVFEFFSRALAEKSMSILFQISKTP